MKSMKILVVGLSLVFTVAALASPDYADLKSHSFQVKAYDVAELNYSVIEVASPVRYLRVVHPVPEKLTGTTSGPIPNANSPPLKTVNPNARIRDVA